MRTNLLRHVAFALGLCFAATSVPAADYVSPARWSNFNVRTTQTPNSPFRVVGTGEALNHAVNGAMNAQPMGQSLPMGQSIAQPQVSGTIMQAPNNASAYPAPIHQGQILSDTMLHQSAPQVVSSTPQSSQTYCQPQYQPAPVVAYESSPQVITENCSGAQRGYYSPRRGGISPWFGGVTLYSLDVHRNGNSRPLIIDDAVGTRRLSADDVAPDDDLAYEVHIGRYLACGLYGLDFNYFNYDPDREQHVFVPAAGVTYRPTTAGLHNVQLPIYGMPVMPDPDNDPTVYDLFDGSAMLPGTYMVNGYRVSRDIDVEGIEVNLNSFGWMGSQRQGLSFNQGLGHGRFADFIGFGTGRYGGFGRPANRCGNVQVSTSHGFRWFRLKDSFEFASDADGVLGFGADDIYYNVDTKNNLYGYQFGTRLNYCLTSRLMLNFGGKIGIYGNDVSVRQRLGSQKELAFIQEQGNVRRVLTDNSDTALSTLGQLDLGAGYRLNNAWTVTGGYRVLSVCGVATAPGSFVQDFSSIDTIGAVNADDCFTLRGAYVGLEFNW